MTTQTKKGFTLIELMVVIVIIGILAAIAIPKLFGMSAKAKASEVGPSAGTWSKMQLAYKMETGKFGSAQLIGYQLPGTGGKTSNFEYAAEDSSWEAKSQFPSDPCETGAKWKASFTNQMIPEMSIDGTTKKGCLSLTPNFYKIGCAAGSETDADEDDKCSAKTDESKTDES